MKIKLDRKASDIEKTVIEMDLIQELLKLLEDMNGGLYVKEDIIKWLMIHGENKINTIPKNLFIK